ncbi:MAG: VWA domain-containing protein, partial [Polyangiaceae bacterium]
VRAIHDVLFAMGHRVAYGAALFPERGNTEDCSPGRSIDEVRAGDSVTYARNDLDGPHLAALMKVLNGYRPEGSTPTSGTLEALMPMLLALKGDTAVILTTDGAPNCNGEASCDASSCIANIEGALQFNGKRCDATVNCCAPTGDYGPYSCIDEAATLAPLDTLLEHGIRTYVVGLPGTEAYTSVLNRLARAGGTARSPTSLSDPEYYRVEDSAALVAALKTITSGLAIDCTVVLDAAVPEWSKVNVYFDNGIVRMNEKDGWRRVDDKTLELVGSSCTALKSGDVFQVQIVSGCPTETIQ